MIKTTSIWLLECFGLASLNPRNSEIGFGIEWCLSRLLASEATSRERLPRADDYTRLLSLLSTKMREATENLLVNRGHQKSDIADLLIKAMFVRDYGYGSQSLLEAAFIYDRHNDWLRNRLGFDAEQLIRFAFRVFEILQKRFPAGAFDDPADPDHVFWAKGWITFDGYPSLLLPSKSILRTYGPCLEFSPTDFADIIPDPIYQAILSTFAQPMGKYPAQAELTDPCPLVRYPLVKAESDCCILPHPLLLPTAIVEVPELLIQQDESYYRQVIQERGPVSEDRLEAIVSHTFGAGFICRNQLNPKGKELSDFIVWNGEQLIIFESKYLGRPAWEASLERYGAKVLKRMAQAQAQLGGALRTVTELKRPAEWVNVAGGTSRFEGGRVSEIHLVAVLTEAIRLSPLIPGSENLQVVRDHWVHYFSIKDLNHLLRYLSTVADFCHYLRERERGLRTGKFFDQFEEDLLGWYFRHGKTFGLDWIQSQAEQQPDFVTFPGFWEDIASRYKTQLRNRFVANRVSYWVDHVLKILAPQYGPDSPIVRELGKLNRLERRALGETATRKAWQAADENRPVWSVGGSESLPTRFLLVFVPKEWPRERRRILVENLLVAGLIRSGAERIVAIASEAADSQEQTYDFGYLEGPMEINEEERKLAERTFARPYHVRVKEFPDEVAD